MAAEIEQLWGDRDGVDIPLSFPTQAQWDNSQAAQASLFLLVSWFLISYLSLIILALSNTDFLWNDEELDQFSLRYGNNIYQWVSLLCLNMKKYFIFSGREKGGRNGHDGQINFAI